MPSYKNNNTNNSNSYSTNNYSNQYPMETNWQSEIPGGQAYPGQSTVSARQPGNTTQNNWFPDPSFQANEGFTEDAILSHSSDLPETIINPIYTPSFLRTQIGKIMRVEFLVGDNITDRVGRLLAVGASYILLRSIDPGSTIMCDIYSIKFVTIIDTNQIEKLYNF